MVYLPPWQETLPFHLLAGCNWSVAPFGAVHHANNRLPAEDGNKSVESALATANKAKRRSFPDTFRCCACRSSFPLGDRGAQIEPRSTTTTKTLVSLVQPGDTPSVFSYHRLLNRNAVRTAKVTGSFTASSAFLAFPSPWLLSTRCVLSV